MSLTLMQGGVISCSISSRTLRYIYTAHHAAAPPPSPPSPPSPSMPHHHHHHHRHPPQVASTDLTDRQRSSLRRWLDGTLTGRECILDFSSHSRDNATTNATPSKGNGASDAAGGASASSSGSASSAAGSAPPSAAPQGQGTPFSNVDHSSTLGAIVGLGSVLQSEWLYKRVFSRPPQAVLREALQLCAEEALEVRRGYVGGRALEVRKGYVRGM